GRDGLIDLFLDLAQAGDLPTDRLPLGRELGPVERPQLGLLGVGPPGRVSRESLVDVLRDRLLEHWLVGGRQREPEPADAVPGVRRPEPESDLEPGPLLEPERLAGREQGLAVLPLLVAVDGPAGFRVAVDGLGDAGFAVGLLV